MKKKKLGIILIIIIFAIILSLFLIRILSPSEIDDVSPGISCPEIQEYNPDILWVIPKFNDIPISDNMTWCMNILSLNKSIQLHGYEHRYKEFDGSVTSEQIDEAITIFTDCFGFKPTEFKPPQLALSKENMAILESKGIIVKNRINQVLHKVYHCEDTGRVPNKFISIF